MQLYTPYQRAQTVPKQLLYLIMYHLLCQTSSQATGPFSNCCYDDCVAWIAVTPACFLFYQTTPGKSPPAVCPFVHVVVWGNILSLVSSHNGHALLPDSRVQFTVAMTAPDDETSTVQQLWVNTGATCTADFEKLNDFVEISDVTSRIYKPWTPFILTASAILHWRHLVYSTTQKNSGVWSLVIPLEPLWLYVYMCCTMSYQTNRQNKLVQH